MGLGKKLLRVSATFVSCTLAPALVSAQGCALCYTQAAGSGQRMIQALKSGILILVVPPMLICLGITWMAYKKRNEFNEDLPEDPGQD
ncbi:MAG TPA: hypothetical protein VMS50_00060 [Candidatus Bathyarchaeia archaeon]|nr:hypothetical protein [Terriglobales bacterium]HVN17772.1 hypothetical protein [Dongiaceae bacterium]HVP63239.1 hypothetical protein [Candidatus Bathyarchaeia archaeon]